MGSREDGGENLLSIMKLKNFTNYDFTLYFYRKPKKALKQVCKHVEICILEIARLNGIPANMVNWHLSKSLIISSDSPRDITRSNLGRETISWRWGFI